MVRETSAILEAKKQVSSMDGYSNVALKLDHKYLAMNTPSNYNQDLPFKTFRNEEDEHSASDPVIQV